MLRIILFSTDLQSLYLTCRLNQCCIQEYIYVAASIGMGHNRHNVFVFVTWRVWCPPNMTSSVVATQKKKISSLMMNKKTSSG